MEEKSEQNGGVLIIALRNIPMIISDGKPGLHDKALTVFLAAESKLLKIECPCRVFVKSPVSICLLLPPLHQAHLIKSPPYDTHLISVMFNSGKCTLENYQ